MKRHVVIVAGGSGSRMKQALPKQFMIVEGKPVLVHTIQAFLDAFPDIHIVLVLPEAHLELWQVIQSDYLADVPVTVALGGNSRFQSVGNGLGQVDEGLVAIHDAVRPCVSVRAIRGSFEQAQDTGSGVVAVPLKDSLRFVSDQGSEACDRTQYQIVQTPQTFQVELIKQAFEVEEQSVFTDDASVFEWSLRRQVSLVEGDYRNIKITTPEDLLIVAQFLKTKNPE